jgi:hypothetical protein
MKRAIFGSESVTSTNYRDQIAELAKTDTEKAAKITREIRDPWFEAQAWSHVARYADSPLEFAAKASMAATKTKDDYQRSAVRAWEIAALAEQEYFDQARQALTEAVELAKIIDHEGSKAEALLLLFQAAFKVSKDDATYVAKLFEETSSLTHWRAKRALKDIASMLQGERPPREFFW